MRDMGVTEGKSADSRGSFQTNLQLARMISGLRKRKVLGGTQLG